MTKDAFLQRLREELAGLPDDEIGEILADYGAYFEDAEMDGRPAEEVVQALGDPNRLARELRTERSLRRWERERTARSLLGAILALGGLALVDLVVLLPLLLIVGLVLLALSLPLVIVGIVGFAKLVSLLPFGAGPPADMVLQELLTGIGLVAASLGGGMLLLIVLRTGMAALARYVRLHYRLLHPIRREAAESETAAQSENA
jgi:uncharacterized membrane protein